MLRKHTRASVVYSMANVMRMSKAMNSLFHPPSFFMIESMYIQHNVNATAKSFGLVKKVVVG